MFQNCDPLDNTCKHILEIINITLSSNTGTPDMLQCLSISIMGCSSQWWYQGGGGIHGAFPPVEGSVSPFYHALDEWIGSNVYLSQFGNVFAKLRVGTAVGHFKEKANDKITIIYFERFLDPLY